MKEIIINETEEGRTITLLEDYKLAELYEEKHNRNMNDGNIYCGIVRNILPGMQSAFVDIGERKNGFLHIKDLIPKASNETGNKCEKMSKYNIKDYIEIKKPILVQVKKEEEGQKGAKISTNIHIAGRYAILMSNTNFVTISQKITDKEEIVRLKNIASSILKKLGQDKISIIIRTCAQGVSEELLEEDIKRLVILWKKINDQYKEIKALGQPIKIYEAANTLQKIIIGTATEKNYCIKVNNDNLENEVKQILDAINMKSVKVEKVSQGLMDIYDLKNQIEDAKKRKIWLKSGGFITIDPTEALTAIDVNSGKFIGNKRKEKDDTIFNVNKEATIEIAKQLRIKNISGIIIIDYIDMEEIEDKKKIEKILKKELEKDRSKTQVIGFTKLDLLEMTRKKM